MKLNRSDVVKYLTHLDEKEFSELFYEVVSAKGNYKKYKNGDFLIENVHCLAVCSFGSHSGVVNDKATVKLVGQPSLLDEGGLSGAFTEQGECSFCKSEVLSATALAQCPVCKREVDLAGKRETCSHGS